jgi:hypothetical protein
VALANEPGRPIPPAPSGAGSAIPPAQAAAGTPIPAGRAGSARADAPDGEANGHAADTAIRPERFARLVTLASILIDAGRAGRLLSADALCHDLKVSGQELREDVSVLNVVNFGAGTYVLYAEILPDGMIEVDPEPYGDSFDRPARLLPVEAKALVAAIDLIGEHIPEGSLQSVREKVVAALGEDPAHEGLQFASPGGDDAEIAAVVSRAISSRRLLSFEYYKENEDEFTSRLVEPYALINGPTPPRRTCAISAWIASSRLTSPTRPSSRAPTSTPLPMSTGGRGPARSRPRVARGSGSRRNARAGFGRSGPCSPRCPTARSSSSSGSPASTGSCGRS